jgi:hypothetical protein
VGVHNRRVRSMYLARRARPTTVFGDVVKELIA